MEADHSQTNTHRTPLIVIAAIFIPLGTFVAFLRLYLRAWVARVPGYDDLMMGLAWLASAGFSVCAGLALRDGMGMFGSEVPLQRKQKSVQDAFYLEIFYYLSIFFIKMSLMMFYLRFTEGLRGKFWIASLVVIAIVVLQFASTVVVVLVQCRPIAFYWNHDYHGECINITDFFYSTNIFTIVTDVIILALPIPTLFVIKRSPTQKVALFAVFLLGGLSTIASCIRLYTIRIYTTSHDPVYDSAPITMWSFIEINLGIICASGPALKVLFTSLKRGNNNTSSMRPPSYTSDPSLAARRRASESKGSALRSVRTGTTVTTEDPDGTEMLTGGDGRISPTDKMTTTTSISQTVRSYKNKWSGGETKVTTKPRPTSGQFKRLGERNGSASWSDAVDAVELKETPTHSVSPLNPGGLCHCHVNSVVSSPGSHNTSDPLNECTVAELGGSPARTVYTTPEMKMRVGREVHTSIGPGSPVNEAENEKIRRQLTQGLGHLGVGLRESGNGEEKEGDGKGPKTILVRTTFELGSRRNSRSSRTMDEE